MHMKMSDFCLTSRLPLFHLKHRDEDIHSLYAFFIATLDRVNFSSVHLYFMIKMRSKTQSKMNNKCHDFSMDIAFKSFSYTFLMHSHAFQVLCEKP